MHIPHNQFVTPRFYRITSHAQLDFLKTNRYEWTSKDNEIVWEDYFTHDLWVLVNPHDCESAEHLNNMVKETMYNIEVVCYVSTTEECILWSATTLGVTMMSTLLQSFQEQLGISYAQIMKGTTTRMWTPTCSKLQVHIDHVVYLVTVKEVK